jgi:hypothetical protein
MRGIAILFRISIAIEGRYIPRDYRTASFLENIPALLHNSLLETVDRSAFMTGSSGRRRTVQDNDCDRTTGQIDSIEADCSRYRFKVFQEQYGVMMSAAYNDSQMLSDAGSLNDSFTGGLVSFGDGGIRQIYKTQKDALYGPNGTCISPKPGGLTTVADVGMRSAFTLAKGLSASSDTGWANLLTIDNQTNIAFTTNGQIFANTTGTVMQKMNRFQALMFSAANKMNTDMVTTLNNDWLQNVSSGINNLSDALTALVGYTESNYTDFHKNVDPIVNNLLDQLDALSDKFLGADGDFKGVVDNVATKMSPVLTAIPGKEATDPINAIRAKGAANTNDFLDSSNAAVNNSQADWARSILSSTQGAQSDMGNHLDYINNGQSQIDSNINTTSDGMDNNFTIAMSVSKQRISDLRNTASDLRSTVWSMSSKLHNVKGSLQSLYEALDGATGQAAADLRTKIGTLLSSTGDASATQLQSILAAFANVQQQISGSGNANNAKLMAAVSNIRGMVGRTSLDQAGSSGNMQDSISSQSEYASNVTSSTGSMQDGLVKDAGKTVLNTANSVLTAVTDASSQFDSQKSGVQRDTRSALSDESDLVADANSETQLAGAQSKVDVVGALSGNASAILNTASSADSSMKNTLGTVNGALGTMGSLSESLNGASSQSADAIGSVEDQLGGIDDHIADQYAQGTTNAYASVSGKADSSQEAITGNLGTSASGFANSVGTLVSQGDQSAGKANSNLLGALGANDETSSDLGIIGGSIGDLLENSVNGRSDAVNGANRTLASVLLGALTGAQSVGSKVDSASSETDSSISTDAGKAVDSVLSSFEAKASSVLQTTASVPGSLTKSNATIAQSQGVFNESLNAIAGSISESQDGLNWIKDNVESGGNMGMDGGLLDVKRTMFSSMDAISQNLTALNASVSKVAFNISSGVGFPSSFQDALTDIVNDAIRSADFSQRRGQQSVDQLAETSMNASRDSVGILSDLNDASNSWEAGYSSAIRSSIDASRARVGDLSNVADGASGISSLLSTVKGNRGKISSDASRLSDMSGSELELTVSQLMGSVRASKSSLQRASGSASAQSDFGSKVNNGIAGQFMQALATEANLASQASGDSENAMQQVGGRASMDIQRMEQGLATDQQARSAKMAEVMANVGNMDSEFAKNISGNKDAVSIQLLMSKRAVRNILNSWTRYSDYETAKFEKMGQTDQDHVQMTQRQIDSSRTDNEGKLLSSRNTMDSLSSELENVVGDYLSFTNSSESQLGLLSQVVPLLNESATGSIGQLSESAFTFVRTDGDLDSAARNETLSAIKDFEASLDQRASMAIAAANGNLVPALAGG